MQLTRILACISFVLAGTSAMAAISYALEDRQPRIAAATGFGDGMAKAEFATSLLATGVMQGSDPKLDLSKVNVTKVETLSRESYLQEPLSVGAIRNLGLLAEASGKPDRARKLMNDARKLTRRDLSTNSFLVREFARKQDLPGLLRTFDEALRTSNEARQLMLPQLIAGLSEDELVQPLLSMLRKNPNWEVAFWEQAHTAPQALSNIVRLRMARGKDGYEPPIGYDLRIMEQLVRTGRFFEAEQLHDLIAPNPGQQAKLVRNASFDEPAGRSPFGWEILPDADLNARLDTTRGQLRFSVYGSKETVVARQLVRLPGEPLALRTTPGNTGSAPGLGVRLSCAQSPMGGSITFPAPLAGNANFQRPGPACEYYWLEVVMQLADKRGLREGSLSEINIIPANPGASKVPE